MLVRINRWSTFEGKLVCCSKELVPLKDLFGGILTGNQQENHNFPGPEENDTQMNQHEDVC